MQIYSFEGLTPVVSPSAYVHPSAILIGDVIIGDHCYVGPAASLRGDFGRIIVHQGSNIQDTCVLHSFPRIDAVIEENGHIGHGAVIHACHIGKNVMVGMNAVIMDGALIGEYSIVAATSFVKAKFNCPPRTLIGGTPAKIMRQLCEQDINWKKRATQEYHKLTLRCMESIQPAQALTEVEADRKRLQDARDMEPLHQLRERTTGDKH